MIENMENDILTLLDKISNINNIEEFIGEDSSWGWSGNTVAITHTSVSYNHNNDYYQKIRDLGIDFYKNLLKVLIIQISEGQFHFRCVEPKILRAYSSVAYTIKSFDKERLIGITLSTGEIYRYSNIKDGDYEFKIKFRKYDINSRKSIDYLHFLCPKSLFEDIICLVKDRTEKGECLKKAPSVNDLTKDWKYDILKELNTLGTDTSRQIKMGLIFSNDE